MNEHAKVQSQLYEYVKNELDDEHRERIKQHLETCSLCNQEVQQLASFLSEVDKTTVDWSVRQPEEYWNTFAYSVQARIKKEAPKQISITERFTEWLDSIIAFHPKDFAIAGAICILLLGSIVAGKYLMKPTEQTPQSQAQQVVTPPVDSGFIKLHDYFRRSKILLVGLANTRVNEEEEVNMEAEQAVSRNLLRQARLLKQQPLDSRSERLISDMERILRKFANSEIDENSPALEVIREGIERANLLYKVRRAESVYQQPNVMLANYKEE